VKERDDMRFRSAWTGAERMFRFYRDKHAPVGMALDPRSGHECADSRYLAIPFFDACLGLRLPARGAADQTLQPVSRDAGWLAPWLGGEALPANEFTGDRGNATWLPSETVARAWQSYVKTGFVDDATEPPEPVGLNVSFQQRAWRVTWQAEADFESGLSGFIVLRDGVEVGRVPERRIEVFGKGLFQRMSYHDTPEKPLPQMLFIDRSTSAESSPSYQVIAINAAGKQSKPSAKTTGVPTASGRK